MIVEDNPTAFNTAALGFCKISVSMQTERSFLMSKREVIIPKGMESLYEKFHYAPAVRVENTLYIAGQVGRDDDLHVIQGAEAQFAQAFENLRKVFTAAGATLEDVVDLVTYPELTRFGGCLVRFP